MLIKGFGDDLHCLPRNRREDDVFGVRVGHDNDVGIVRRGFKWTDEVHMDPVVEPEGRREWLERSVNGLVLNLFSSLARVTGLDVPGHVGLHGEPGEGVGDPNHRFRSVAVAADFGIVGEFDHSAD